MSINKNKSLPKTVFGQRLKEARLKQNLSQKRLGILAKIDEFSASPRINQYERGTHSPDYQMACRLAEVLKIPVFYLYIDNPDWLEIVLLLSLFDEKDLIDIKYYLKQKINSKGITL